MATTAASSTNAEKGKEGNRKKLTEVVSTKLSIEDDKCLAASFNYRVSIWKY